MADYNLKSVFLKHKLVIFLICIVLSLLVIFLTFNFGQPEPFRGITHNSTKSDIEKLYGKADETKEFVYPKNKFYDLHCDESFLNIKADIEVTYNDNGTLSRCEFSIDSNDYKNEAEYNRAVQKVYSHFNKVLFFTKKIDRTDTDENGEKLLDICWKYDDYCSYSMYETEMWDDDNYFDIRPCTVFAADFYDVNPDFFDVISNENTNKE